MTTAQHDEDPQRIELLRVARIGRAQGLKGEVNVHSFTDEPERRFASGSVLYSEDGRKHYHILRSRSFKGRWIILCDGIDTREASEALNGLELYAPADDPEIMAQHDTWYPKDLIGLEAKMASGNALGLESGMSVGTVTDVVDGPAQSLLKVRRAQPEAGGDLSANAHHRRKGEAETKEGTTALVPFVKPIVPDVNTEKGYLTINPPGGLIAWLQG